MDTFTGDIKPNRINTFHKKYFEKIKNKKFPIFSVVEFNLHGSCNRRCAFCPRVDESKWPNIEKEISLDLFNKIISELKEINYSGRISFSGFSEPFLHSNLQKLVEKMHSDIPEAKIEIITNGDFIKVDNVKKLFNS